MPKRLHISVGGRQVSELQRRISDNEFVVKLPIQQRVRRISLQQFQILNLVCNVHPDNNKFIYFHAGVEKTIVIPQNSYSLAALIQKISDLLSAQSSITVTYTVVDNKLSLVFTQAIRWVYSEDDTIYKRLGFTSANVAFSNSSTQHIGNNVFNLAQTPVIYIHMVNVGIDGDLIQNQHFSIPNDSSYGSWITFNAMDRNDNSQQVERDDPISLNEIRFKLYDYDGHELHTGLNNQSSLPIVAIIDLYE